MRGYEPIFECLLDDVAFLWLQRHQAEDHLGYFIWDLASMDERIQSYLRALLQAPDISWRLFEASADVADAGYFFAAAILAFHSLDTKRIKKLIEWAAESEACVLGLSSALSCLPGSLVHPWIKKFLISKVHHHQHLALLTCLVRREDPRSYLSVLIERPDSRSHEGLFLCALKLAGTLKRADLLPLLRHAMCDEARPIQFWAAWSCALLRDVTAAPSLQKFAMGENEWQQDALASVLLLLDAGPARSLVDEFARNDATQHLAIDGCALLGDASALPWLLQMAHLPEFNQRATQAIVTITGVELEKDWLSTEPHRLAEEDNSDLDEEPFIDPDKLIAALRQQNTRWQTGQRYFLGQPLQADRVLSLYPRANQRHRRTAAFHLAALFADRPLPNHALGEPFRL